MEANSEHTMPRIFIVNDDRVHREQVQVVLSSLFKVTSFADNNAAYDAMQLGRPDLVIVDERMIENGKGCLFDKRKDSKLKDLPFIIVGKRSAEKYMTGVGAEADSLVLRPFTKNSNMIQISDALSFGVEKKWEALPELEKRRCKAPLMNIRMFQKPLKEMSHWTLNRRLKAASRWLKL